MTQTEAGLVEALWALVRVLDRPSAPRMLLTQDQAAAACGVSKSQLKAWIRVGKVRVVRIQEGAHPLISVEELQRLIREHTEGALQTVRRRPPRRSAPPHDAAMEAARIRALGRRRKA